VAAIAGYPQIVWAVSQPRALISEAISETKLVTLAGNTRPEATAANDRGPVDDSFPMEHLWLQLRRSPEREQALESYIDQLSDRHSPNFHHWLTAKQVGERYGLAQEDLATITGWLESHGFTVDLVYPSRVVIEFSGTAGQVREAFHTEIHNLEVDGKKHIANMSDPQIPAALAPAIVGIVSLNDFMPRPMYRPRAAYTYSGCGGDCYPVVPADLATIYNLNPLFAAGYSGQGQTIVVVEDTDVYNYPEDWDTFRSTFGLDSYSDGSFIQVHPTPGTGGTCDDPGVLADAEDEAILDAEWASAAAPSAAIELASCENTTANFGGFIAMQNIVSKGGAVPAIVSISYGDSEPLLGTSANSYIKSLYQLAVAEGVSVFVSSGDGGAAMTDFVQQTNVAQYGINVSGFASTQYNVAVGGTDFGDTYANVNGTYWSATNSSDYGSALSYVPEIPWNETCGSELAAIFFGYSTTYGSGGFCNSGSENAYGLSGPLSGGSGGGGAGGGGASGCATGSPKSTGVVGGSCAGYPKPSWQSGLFGNPSDTVRDLPDVSLFAANGAWNHYYVFCDTDPSDQGTCTGPPSGWLGAGGTSFSAPIMAGIQSLVNQYTASRQGNPNPEYYTLAKTEYGASGSSSCSSTLGNAAAASCIFYDVTEGDMDVPCTGSHNCYKTSGTYGVLSTSNSAYQPAYGTNAGWDFATGIGTVNAYNLVIAFGANPTPTTLSAAPAKLSFGNVDATGTSKPKKVTLTNKGTAAALIGSVTATPPLAIASGANTCSGQSIAPKKKCSFDVEFAPATPGAVSGGSIDVSYNGTSPTVSLSGTGIAVKLKAASKETFSPVAAGAIGKSKAIKISNPATVSVSLGATSIAGDDPSSFTITANSCTGTLAAKGNCTITMEFTPGSGATGAQSATVGFSYTYGANGGSVSIPISGTVK
jgi:hypothetical protein